MGKLEMSDGKRWEIIVVCFGSVAGHVIWVQGYGILMVAETQVESSSVIDGAVLGFRVDAAE